MLLLMLSYLGGVLTIFSPCVLPVIPFVFARADRPFRRSGLPILLGMAATFAMVATLAAVGGSWVVTANQYGRIAAMVLLALLGLTLLLPALAERVQQDRVAHYSARSQPALNQWGLAGQWKVGDESATLARPDGAIVYRFRGRDLHLVLGNPHGTPVRFRVMLDDAAPGADHGADIDSSGNGTVNGNRLYQLVRQQDGAQERTFKIEFLDPGVQAFAFTFG